LPGGEKGFFQQSGGFGFGDQVTLDQQADKAMRKRGSFVLCVRRARRAAVSLKARWADHGQLGQPSIEGGLLFGRHLAESDAHAKSGL
jgi:hypothetical protein